MLHEKWGKHGRRNRGRYQVAQTDFQLHSLLNVLWQLSTPHLDIFLRHPVNWCLSSSSSQKHEKIWETPFVQVILPDKRGTLLDLIATSLGN